MPNTQFSILRVHDITKAAEVMSVGGWYEGIGLLCLFIVQKRHAVAGGYSQIDAA